MPLATVIVTFWAEDSHDAARRLEGVQWPAGADVRATLPVEVEGATSTPGMASVPPAPPIDPTNPPDQPVETPAEIPSETPPEEAGSD